MNAKVHHIEMKHTPSSTPDKHNLIDVEKDSNLNGSSAGEEEDDQSFVTQQNEIERRESNSHKTSGQQHLHRQKKPPQFASREAERVQNDDMIHSDDSSSLETDSDEEVLTLMQRREQNILRNHRRLVEKGLASGVVKKKPSKQASSRELDAEPISTRRRGMLLRHNTINQTFSAKTAQQIITHLEALYPCLSLQIRKIFALLSGAYAQAASGQQFYNPSPIFVTGSSGSGKTSVVRDIVEAMKSLSSTTTTNATTAQIMSAYVNCDTLDVHSFDELAVDIYSQLVNQTNSRILADMTDTKKSRKRRRKTQSDELKLTTISVLREKDAEALEKAEKFEEEIEDRIERNRGRGKKRTVGREQNTAVVEGSASQTKSSIASQTAAWSLAESLKALLGQHDCVFMILDRAERTLSFHANGSNFVAQLLLHLRTLGLNVSVIIISNSSLLHHMRVNLLTSAERSSSSVATMFHPVNIHFPVAKDAKSVKKILNSTRLRNHILGNYISGDGELHQILFSSFLDTSIQYVSNLNTDINEHVRICRSLWPLYISPLDEANMEKTLSSISKSLNYKRDSPDELSKTSIQRELLSFLDKRLHKHIQQVLDRGIFCLAMDSPSVNGGSPFLSLSATQCLPQYTKVLLLAAFICQKNRPDKDKNLFVIERNGRKRSSKGEGNAEAVAFGTDATGEHVTSSRPRPRTFLLERLLSVFVSLITLHQTDAINNGQNSETKEGGAVGATSSFAENFNHLQEIGLIHEYPGRTSTESIRLMEPRYWCSLSESDAFAIAKSMHFSLDRYLS